MDTTSKANIGSISALQNHYLNGALLCRIPIARNSRGGEGEIFTHEVEIKQAKDLLTLLAKDPVQTRFIFQTIWALVLRCYTGQNDVCFAYKEKLDSEEVAGLPVVRLILDEAATLTQSVKQARRDYTGALESVAINIPNKSVCNTLLSLSRSLNTSIEDPASSSSELCGSTTSQFDLHIEARVSSSSMRMSLHSWKNSSESVLNIASTIDQVLSVLLSAPMTPVTGVRYLSDRNKSQIQDFNAGTLQNVKRCIHEVIQDQTVLRPNAEAVCSDDGTTFTYKQLDQLSSQLANYLRRLGIGRGTFVPLCFDKSPFSVVSMLAVMKAGAAFVPLDPAAPLARIKTLSTNVQASVMLCSHQHAGTLRSIVANIIPVDGPMIDQLPDLALTDRLPMARVTSTDLAYLIYTSGSTGEPKGTLIEHGAYCSGAQAHGTAMLMHSGSRVLQFASHVFDASLVEILTTLMVGGVVCIPSEENRLNNLKMAITQMKVNWAVLTPSFVGFIDPADVPELKTLVLAGESMSKTHVQTWSHLNLVNGYGPSECSVASVVNSRVTVETSPSNIGRPTGVLAWIVDAEDHNILVPVGVTGELLIQGPSVARGYHNDPDKTGASFITAPVWVSEKNHTRQSWKVYKTGDLVRQCSDGTLEFVGRKDTQVKVHGQRVELGEIEHHLSVDSDVKHGLVLLPKAGPTRGRLISVLSLSHIDAEGKDTPPLQLTNSPTSGTQSIHDRLSSKLPAYMVPSLLIVVNDIPMLPSGKMDRKTVATWIQNMDDDLYHRVVDSSESVETSEPTNITPATEIEAKLRAVWSHVLNLDPHRVELNRSFMSLGGDSISAMQVRGQCSKQGISLSVQDILRSKSIAQLSQCAKPIEHISHREEVIEQNFALSPIQQMFFKLPNQGHGHFNQSFFLRVTRSIAKKDLRNALETIVQRHSMLRARFSRTGPHEDWQQRITKNASSSYRLKAFRIANPKQATWAIADSQTCLDFERGPLFAADLFDVDGQDQLLFLVAHHLVIDLVSWRNVLEELEDLLTNPETCTTPMPASFQTWCQMQLENSQSVLVDKVLPAQDIPVGDADYWGMSQDPNNYGDVACEGFEIDQTTTSMLLSDSLDALHTEPLDILLSALIGSFATAFTDRPVPAIYNEGHGREPSGMAIDLDRIIGWFTIMYPVHVPSSATTDPISIVKHVKDFRRKVPDNGRPYFASRCLTEEGNARFDHHWPLEVTFNYLGQYQQLEREGSLLKPVDAIAGETRGAGGTADVGQSTPRFGLFEISAVIIQGKLRFSFTFNRNMKHQDRILQWISGCQQMITTITDSLTHMKPEVTLGDFPLLSITYDDLNKLITEKLPKIGISDVNDVQEIYPCSSMQEGLLISQAKSSAFYAVQVVSELKVGNDMPMSQDILADAWQQVVNRHSSLRTVFIESISGNEGLYDQLVLKHFAVNTMFIVCRLESDALQSLEKKEPLSYIGSNHPPHRFTVCETSNGKIFCKLEISHAIMDGTSMSILLRDLASAYEGSLSHNPGPLYSDYISYLQDQPSEASVEYWRTYLDSVEPCKFPLLNDGRAVAKELRSQRLRFTPSQFLEVQSFCDTNGLTFSNILHTAWGLTLRCYTSSDDTCFGYLTSGRDAPVKGIEDAVGPFINMLVCRVKTSPASRLGVVLEQVQKDYMDCLPHRNTSLAEVQHALHLSGTPLFNTALSYRRLPHNQPAQAPAVSFEECMPTYDPTEFPLSINIEASDQNAAIDLDYWTDYVSDGQATNVGDLFLQCLRNIVHHADATIERLDHVSEHHLEKIQQWNRNMPSSIDECVHRVIQHQAVAQPDAPAISSSDGQFTYADLDILSSKLAHYISGMDIRPETFVPTCFDKSGWTIVAMLAVLKAGGAAVPLDATHPRSAIELRVRDTEARVVLTSPARAELFEDMGVHVVSVGKELLDQLPTFATEACPSVGPTNPCFIIYTSGSTGKPKGVVLEHRAIVTSAHATATVYNWGPFSRVLQFAAYTFDNSLAEIFFTLMRGGCVCVPSEDDRFNDLAGAINRLKVNFMDITPTVASFLRPSDVPTVKGLSLGGEPLTKENIETWEKEVALHCCYGPSECSVNSTWNGNLGNSSEATNIGRSIGSVSWIVDADNHNYLTPIGGVGELLIEGPILAREYLHDPEKTAKAFISGPAWAGDTRRRMYKTGDLARYNSDGTITYFGRKDTQVKLNGQRIELGEIEHHLKSNLDSEVQSAVELITTSTSQKATKALAAFLCMPSDVEDENGSFFAPMSDPIRELSAKLETAIAAAVPSYMVPTIYIPVSRMPMTSSGKLDRRTLRTACHVLSEDEASTYRLARKSSRPPTTDVEKILAELWESVLNLEKGSIGADDNFFRVGGDSIGAMKLITAARVKRVSITVANIFQHPKLSELSTDAVITLSKSQLQPAQQSLEPFSMVRTEQPLKKLVMEVATECRVDVGSICDIYPCTAIQEGLVALSNKDPGAYVAQNIYRLPADIDVDWFCAAWQKVVQAEVILRTRVVYTKMSGFLQVVVRDPMMWSRATNLQSVVDQDRQLPAFNGGPLSKYTIVEEVGQSPHFVWTAHHALYDGWCIPLMLERVEACYHNFKSVDTAIGGAYPKFIQYLTNIDSAESDNFWKAKLSETTAVAFPAIPYPGYQVHATSIVTHRASLTRAAGTQITLPSMVRAAWALVLATYSGNNEDVIFGETLTGRDAPVDDITDMIGPTLATIPTRIRINPKTTIGRFMDDVQRLSSEAIPFQYAGLQHIKHLNEDTANASGFQNLLAVHHEVNEADGGFWDLRSSGTVGTNFYSYPLTVSCQLGDGTLEIDAHYDENVISTWLVEKMLAQLDHVLQCLNSTKRRNERLGEIKLLNPQDQAAILKWNSTPVETVNECVHQLIGKQVLQQPRSKIAVESWDGTFTYGELDQLSTYLARHLVTLGVEGSLVPLCFEKSAWTIVAMLAIMKAGGAFVPLDPAAPIARLRDIIGDTESRLILCSPQYRGLCKTLVHDSITVDRQILEKLAATTAQLPSVDCNAPAYLIFTSGSTGKPKGTIIQHKAFAAGALSHGPALRINSASRSLQFASYTFDASLLEILTTLILGGCVCVPSDEQRMNNIAGVINDMKVTWTLLTPSFIQLVQPSSIPTLRTLCLGGEAMSQSHISTWADKLELINAYGPSECAVVATANPTVTLSSNPNNMGRAVGGRSWITDALNPNRLVPVGSVGELIIEGPILAQGYLKNQAKTAKVFITNPAWASEGVDRVSTLPRRMYCTGDLVKYTPDGNLIFCGRKDNQAKLRGQRLELGEVEHHLRLDPLIQHSLATIPKDGFCKKRLIAILSLQEIAASSSSRENFQIVSRDASSFYLSGIRGRLCEHLPAYMIPSNWIVVQKLPLLPSGKLDRRQIEKWVEVMSADTYHLISDLEHTEADIEGTTVEQQLREIWGAALNLPSEQIGIHQSFLHLGGDSISAMQVMSGCRAAGLGVTVQDIIQSKSISQLALRVTLPEEVSTEPDNTDEPFSLTPIQTLFFECVGTKWNHFNQSVMLRLDHSFDDQKVAEALQTIVNSHSMLRASFTKNEAGVWQQRISPESQSSHRFQVQTVRAEKIPALVKVSQEGLDIEKGPVFAVDLLNVEGQQDRLLSIVAHHLVIDVVSWRIILHDLEEFLGSGQLKLGRPLPFQTWSRLQLDNAQRLSLKCTPLEKAPVADLSYWGMDNKSNTYGETTEDGFEIDAETSLLLLGTCHESMETEPVDVFLASVLQSFRKVFVDRTEVPAIYNEGHGREPWASSKLDLSRTVGWFTTMCPVFLPTDLDSAPDLVKTIRWVKDLRRRIPDKGRPYFANRLLTAEGRERFAGHWPMEITFNYLGKLQQMERADSILQPPVQESTHADFDIGRDVPRFALFEISAAVTHGNLKISFSYNKNMKRQAKIRRWVVECQRSLQDAAKRLVQMKPEQTLSNFPLLPLAYNGVALLIEKLPKLGVRSLEEIEDVYPCSPIQQGMLLAQLKNPTLYAYSAVFEATNSDSQQVDARYLAEAWQAIVRRHPTLRTVFIESVCEKGVNDQIVLKDTIARIAWLECTDENVTTIMEQQKPINFRDYQPPHRFTLCKTDRDRVFCKLEISHVISDGTSIPILLNDLAVAYKNCLSSISPPVSEQTMPSKAPLYSAYISHIQTTSLDEDLDYWKAYLSGIEPCHLSSLNDGIKPTKELSSLVLRLSQTAELRAFCNKNGVTLSNVLQFVWALILRSYTGSDEVCFGYLTSGRDAPISGLQDAAVGAFINMLTCRIDLSDSLGVAAAVEQIQNDYMKSMSHQSCSLAEVQHELQLSSTSLFNTAFTFQNRTNLKEPTKSTISFDILEAHDPSEYDVTVNVEALESGVEIHFGYWSTCLSDAQAKNIATTFEHLVNGIISSSQESKTIGSLKFLSDESRQQIMNWNKCLPNTIDRCIHDVILDQTSNRPMATPAICAWDGDFTYKQLDESATTLALHLVELGVGPEIFVPLCFEKSAFNIISMLAVMKAGGAFVPLDFSHPEGRLKHFIDDVRADLVLCSRKNLEKVSGATKNAFVVDLDSINQLKSTTETSILPQASPDNAAYIIFTSGTTGRPKGTIIEHAAFCTSAVEHSKAMCMRPSSRVFQFASHTFDASVMEILTTLVIGGCVCIPSEEDRMNDIPAAIQRMGVTWTLLTPSVASTLSPKSVPSLKVLVTGGEAMSSGHLARWKGKCCLINAYGPSETSVIASASIKVDEDGNELNNDSSNIGRAVGGRAWVVDLRNYNKLVPVGGIGELVVEGRIVARGYLNNDQKTAEAFISNPPWLSSVDQRERIYRTGDVVRYNSDGTLSFVARKDTQIKLNGQRIELGEIEHNVKVMLPEDSQSAVDLVAPMSRIATKALAVFFTFSGSSINSSVEDERISGVDEILLSMSNAARKIAKNLDSSLAAILPTYMIPSFYIPVTKMPWMSSGKMDRARLKNIVQNLPKEMTGPYRLASSDTSKTSKAPTTATEKKLQKLWEVVLNIQESGSVGVEDSFFRLGGDSVTAMRLVGAARAEGISLSVIEIFRNPRLCDMSLVCGTVEEERQAELEPFSLLKTEEPVDAVLDELVEQCRVGRPMIVDAYPCSGLQEGLVTLSIKQAGAYVAQNIFKLPKDVDLDLFKTVWQKTVQDVDILRTRVIHLKSSAFLQAVIDETAIPWHTASSLEELEASGTRIPEHNGGPLTRYTIISDGTDQYFVWSIHHALYDGWSLPMVLKRVEMAYLDANTSFSKSSYALFIKYLADVDEQASDEFWRTRLLGSSPLQFPQAQHTSTDRGHNNQMLTHTATISRNTASMGITVPTIIRAAWSMVVAAYSGSNDVVFGETLAGRDIPVQSITDIIGPTFTTVPTRVQVDDSLTAMQFLESIQKMASDVIPYQHAGLQRIKRLDSDTELACDFQNLLVIQTAEEQIENGLWDLQGSGVASNFFTYPLVLECQGGSDKVAITAHYDDHCLSTWQVQRILYQIETVLQQLADIPKLGTNTKLSSVEVFSSHDRDLVRTWNSAPPEQVDACIHEEFEEVALSQPEAPAVSAWDGEFTYEELQAHSTSLAQHLVTLGVGPETFVPICMDKSAWVIVSMLGIMMAGGAFVPLDPAAPAARHQEMIRDVKASIVIASPHYGHRFDGVVSKTICIDESAMNSLGKSSTRLQELHRATSRNAAYVIFTSGSTGRPKGTLVEHLAISSSSVAMRETLLMKPTSRVFQFASFTFDVSVLETLTVLSHGGCICIPSEDMRTRNVAEAINSLNATWAFLTPSVANLIEPSAVPSLEVLVCGGEAMSIENVLKWASKLTLVNGYGPTEASVIAIANPSVSSQRDPTNIGRALFSGRAWITNPENYNQITPVGCVGELLLEGPFLAREYINNKTKTEEAFVSRPSWANLFDPELSPEQPRTDFPARSKMYRTGDLVKYNQDGSITFIGRKDNQVKLNGQRMELGEIEHALDKDAQIQHALVALPKAGPFRKRLVAVVSLTALASIALSKTGCELVQDGPRAVTARSQVSQTRNRLSDILPPYMIPSSWLVVESIPLLPSGKLDRRSVDGWLQSIDDETYERILEAEDEEDTAISATETSKLLQQIFSRVLNIPVQRVKLSKSFLSLGGDSITAMQVMALCRKEKMNFSLSEVLRSKSIHQLALNARFGDEVQHQDEVMDQEFDLSPIQQLYFQSQPTPVYESKGRFNQSFSLEITRRVESTEIKSALHKIVEQHSMLRSRFAKSSSGHWKQRLIRDVASSYRYQTHNLDNEEQIIPFVANSQSSLNIQDGPLFAIDLFELADHRQMIFLAAHHLIIDMVSWRIILGDLEELLNTRALVAEKPLSFQVWSAMQVEQSLKSESLTSTGILPFKLPSPDLKYWGMDACANTYGDVISASFTVDEHLSSLALDHSNRPFRTEPVELFLAAISHSFSRAFVDRGTPAVFNEGHGREPWDSSIDISRTVGWFTTIFPVHVDIEVEEDDVLETVRRMKDVRRSVPGNGRPYFAHRFLTPQGNIESDGQRGPVEIIFNYLGRMQQLEKDDSLLQQWDYPEDEITSKMIADVGPEASRFALFEISAAIVRNKVQFSFLYNSKMQHQQDIHRWITECQATFEEIVERLAGSTSEPSFTLSDFPLLPISYDGLGKIVSRSLPQVGITPDQVEDIYPCAPLQEGLLISQLKNPSLYHFHAVFEVHPAADNPVSVDGQRLAKAWQKVVDRHGSLRAVFADSVYKGDIFNQIVVKKVDSGVLTVQCEGDEDEAIEKLKTMTILENNYSKQPRLPHQAVICETSSGKVYFKAEVNHAVIDGSSANIMLKDLAAAYHGRLPEGLGPLYSDYVSFIKRQPGGVGMKFWRSYLEGARACHFPVLTKGSERRLGSVAMNFTRFPELQDMCRKMNVTLANVMQTAWAFCLRRYTKSEDICFGYLTSGRDVPVNGIQSTIGAFINMLVCRVKFTKQSTLKEVFQKVQNDFLQSLEHQHCSLAQVQHDLMGGKALFNTAVSIQSDSAGDHVESNSISFDPVAAHDPSEYLVTLNIRTLRNDEGIVIRYWTDIMTDPEAQELSDMLARVMKNFINKPHQLVEELDLSKEQTHAAIPEAPEGGVEQVSAEAPQLYTTEIQLRTVVGECVREIIDQLFKSGALVSYDQQKINNALQQSSQQPIKPMIDYSQMSPLPTRPQFSRQQSASTIASRRFAQISQIEQKLLSVWSELLQISEESIQKDDSFFQLGGDSIIAMQMVGMARDEDLALTVANIFRHPTFADMAAVIRMAEDGQTPQDMGGAKDYMEAREARSQAIQNALYQRYSLLEAANVDAFLQENICPRVNSFRGGIVDVFPVTDFQALAVTGTLMESKWMLNYFYLEGKGSLDFKRLKSSISKLVDSFDILRTVFVPYGSRFFQVVLRKLPPVVSLEETDDLADFTTALQQRDREDGPRLGESYLQFTVAKQRGSSLHRIIMRMSHAQYDGVCMPSILGALQAGYKGHSIPPSPAFSTYVRDAARTTTDDHYVYWKDILQGSSMTEIVRRRVPNYSRGTDAPTVLKRIVRIPSLAAQGITPATIIKSAWSLVLARWAAESDIVFGNVISGRNAAVLGVESIIGPCVNLIPVRVNIQNGWTVLDLLRTVQDQQVAAMPYESLGFREIIKHCTSWPAWTNFSTVCQHQNIERQEGIQIGGNEYTLGAVGSQEDFADLTVLSTPQGDDQIEISLIFTSTSGITRSFAEEIFEVLVETSIKFSADPRASLPTTSELLALDRKTVDEEEAQVDQALSSNLQGLGRDDLLGYSDTLTRAWRQILWDKSIQSKMIDLDTSFYELGGDIIGLAQVASLLEQEGYKLRVEDLVDHPIMIEQLALLAVYKKAEKFEKEREAAEMEEKIAPVQETAGVPKKGFKKMLGKSFGLAKKMRQRKGRDDVGGEDGAA